MLSYPLSPIFSDLIVGATTELRSACCHRLISGALDTRCESSQSVILDYKAPSNVTNRLSLVHPDHLMASDSVRDQLEALSEKWQNERSDLLEYLLQSTADLDNAFRDIWYLREYLESIDRQLCNQQFLDVLSECLSNPVVNSTYRFPDCDESEPIDSSVGFDLGMVGKADRVQLMEAVGVDEELMKPGHVVTKAEPNVGRAQVEVGGPNVTLTKRGGTSRPGQPENFALVIIYLYIAF